MTKSVNVQFKLTPRVNSLEVILISSRVNKFREK